ncbi:MAG: TolC family protein [Bacteroidales bacterium]|nr:TolC family protein [Bacteroidales bacterium]
MKYLVVLFFVLVFSGAAAGHESPAARMLTLEEVVAIAREHSPDAMMARHRYRGRYWQYRTFRAGYLPNLRFDATIPNLNRSISPITLPDGSDIFIRRSLATSSGNLSLNQTIGLTGGQLFVRSGLQRIDLIGDDGNKVSYLATPVNIGYSQPIFSYNPYKWERRIEPIRYKEARRQYLESLEEISIRATNIFFDLLLAQINRDINKINLSSNDTLYRIAQGRYELGRIAENDLLQMELNVLNSEATLEQSFIDYEAALFRFRSFLALDDNRPVELLPPDEPHKIRVDVGVALIEARNNRADILTRERQLIEADSQVDQAKAENRFNANLFAVYGLTQSAEELGDAYRNPMDQQQLSVGIQIPILDWGVSKGRVRMAESNRELVSTTVQQALVDFEQEVFLRVMEFNMLDNQLEIARKADVIADKRYEVTRQRFLIGRIDIIELNLALEEKDRAKQRYLAALRNYWRGYYEMRLLTLYDFVNDEPIRVEFERI